MKQKIVIEIPEQFDVMSDSKGAKYITIPFLFPDGVTGAVILLRKTDKEWNQDIKQITIEYANHTRKK